MRSFASTTRTSDRKPADLFTRGRGLEKNAAAPAGGASSAFTIQRKASCACGGGCPNCQAKSNDLKVSQPNDAAEIEADRVADQVLATPVSSAPGGSLPRIQRSAAQSADHGGGAAPASVKSALSGSGRPLEPSLRRDMEQRFGHEFSGVRVYSGAAAGQSAADMNANAYTIGQDIVFGAGKFEPGTQEGRRLIAHELTHVVQQGNHASNTIYRQVAAAAPCPGIVASKTYSRGNDDWLECSYETGRITVSLILDPCACGSGVTTMPLAVSYSAVLEGKRFTGNTIPNPSGGTGTVPQQEGQASHIATGVVTPGRSRTGRTEPGLRLSEDNLPSGAAPNRSGVLNLTIDDSLPGGRPGDPGDTVSQQLSVGSIDCAGSSKSGQVSLGGGYEVINYNISADSTGVQSSAITLAEPGVMQDRVPTPLIDLTGGVTPYPPFPGIPRPGGTGCTCNATTGVQVGTGCVRGTGGSGFGQ